MKAEELRKSILQMAIQGKLVEQDPNDEPASVLLERILQEKKELIKEGKIKDKKVESYIYKGDDDSYYEKIGKSVNCIDEEIPYNIPNDWIWVRLKTIASLGMGQTILKKDLKEKGIPIYSATQGDNYFGYIDESANIIKLSMNDLVIPARGNSIGYVKLVKDPSASCTQTTMYVKPHYKMISQYILFYLLALKTSLFLYNGAAIPQITIGQVSEFLISLPPISEQNRIFERIKEIKSLIQQYSNLEVEESRLVEELPDKLRKSIIQYALQGKLVEQNPREEQASTLLERIHEEKHKLINEGKIKADKNYSFIYKNNIDNSYYEKLGNEVRCIDDKIPFEIPDNWVWAKLSNICEINPSCSSTDDDINASFIPMKLIDDKYSNTFTFEVRKWRDIKKGFTHFCDGDIGFAKITPCFENRKSVIFRNLENGIGSGTTELHILRPFKKIVSQEYLLWLVKSNYFIEYGCEHFTGTAGQQRFGTSALKEILVPVPSINEQIKIVNTIEKCMFFIANSLFMRK